MSGKPPERETRAALARSLGISERTIYRALRKQRDERVARLRQYQEVVLKELREKHPSKSDEQLAAMVNAHIAALSEEQLTKIMGSALAHPLIGGLPHVSRRQDTT